MGLIGRMLAGGVVEAGTKWSEEQSAARLAESKRLYEENKAERARLAGGSGMTSGGPELTTGQYEILSPEEKEKAEMLSVAETRKKVEAKEGTESGKLEIEKIKAETAKLKKETEANKGKAVSASDKTKILEDLREIEGQLATADETQKPFLLEQSNILRDAIGAPRLTEEEVYTPGSKGWFSTSPDSTETRYVPAGGAKKAKEDKLGAKIAAVQARKATGSPTVIPQTTPSVVPSGPDISAPRVLEQGQTITKKPEVPSEKSFSERYGFSTPKKERPAAPQVTGTSIGEQQGGMIKEAAGGVVNAVEKVAKLIETRYGNMTVEAKAALLKRIRYNLSQGLALSKTDKALLKEAGVNISEL